MIAIDQTVKFVLNEWAQTQVETVDQKPVSLKDSKNIYKASLDFDGLFPGKCSVFIPHDLAVLVVQKVLGEEDSRDPSIVRDTLCELVNILTGNLLSACYGEDVSFDLSLPEIKADIEFSKEKLIKHTRFYEVGSKGFAVVLSDKDNKGAQ